VLKTAKKMLQMHKQGIVDPPDDDRQMESQDAPSVMQLFELNLIYLMVQHGDIDKDEKMFNHVMQTFEISRLQDSKCVSLLIKICEIILTRLFKSARQRSQLVQVVVNRLKHLCDQEIAITKKAIDQLDLHHQTEIRNIPLIDQTKNPRRSWDQSNLKASIEICRFVPSFTSRLAALLDKIALSCDDGS
jgi:hypothetical protein